jgi:hypothetical protein
MKTYTFKTTIGNGFQVIIKYTACNDGSVFERDVLSEATGESLMDLIAFNDAFELEIDAKIESHQEEGYCHD